MNIYKITFKNKTTAYRSAKNESQLLEKQKITEYLGFIVDEIKLVIKTKNYDFNEIRK